MPGGLMQLIAYGAENLYLTGNPQITFFKTVYRRHTNFAMEYIEQPFTKLPTFTDTQVTEATVKIGRNADLLYDCYLVYDLPNIYCAEPFKFKWVNNIGLRIIDYVEVFVSGQLLDKQYGQWMYIWNELTLPLSKREAYNKLIGNVSSLTDPVNSFGFKNGVGVVGGGDAVPSIPATRLMIPLEFWFCKNPGLAIPLIALQYTEITVKIHFTPLNDLYTIDMRDCLFSPKNPHELVSHIPAVDLSYGAGSDPDVLSAREDAVAAFTTVLQAGSNLIWYFINGTTNPGEWLENTFLLCNYIYLDDDERRKFALSSHEYLMTQTVRKTDGALRGTGNVVEYHFHHPISEMVWAFQRDDADLRNDWNNFTNIATGENFLVEGFNPDDCSHSLLKDYISSSEVSGKTTTDTPLFNNYKDIMYNCKFIFNGRDRFSTQNFTFFNALVPYKYNVNSPADGIYNYSFALNPYKFQPSGNCNFSRINKFQMNMDLRSAEDPETKKRFYYNMFVYGVNYNVFRIVAGIGGVAFS